MKKTYITPAVNVTSIVMTSMICNSLAGVSGTGSLKTDIDLQETTEEYLSRRRNNVWDDENLSEEE